jgi:hypothetical protein
VARESEPPIRTDLRKPTPFIDKVTPQGYVAIRIPGPSFARPSNASAVVCQVAVPWLRFVCGPWVWVDRLEFRDESFGIWLSSPNLESSALASMYCEGYEGGWKMRYLEFLLASCKEFTNCPLRPVM